MNLIALGEAVKNLDKVSDGELLPKYNQIQWGEGNVQWTFPIASAEKQPPAVAFCQKQKPADSNTAGKNIANPTQQTTTGTSAATGR